LKKNEMQAGRETEMLIHKFLKHCYETHFPYQQVTGKDSRLLVSLSVNLA
jgi:hypothetical protein